MSDGAASHPLLEGIVRDTDSEIASLKRDMEQDIEDKEQSHKVWVKRETSRWEKKLDEALNIERNRIASTLRMDKKKLFLMSQDKLLAGIEEASMHRLETSLMDDDYYKNVMKGWIIEGALSLQIDSIVIEGGQREQTMLTPGFLEDISQTLGGITGRTTRFSLSDQRITHIPGVIMRSEDGRISFNNQIPSRFSRYRSQVRQQINQGLKGVQHG